VKSKFEIAHVFGKSCRKCRKIYSSCKVCPDCQGDVVVVMCPVKVPRGCILVWDDGTVPGNDFWAEMSDLEFGMFQEAIVHKRPGRS